VVAGWGSRPEIAKATGAVIHGAGGELLPNHEVTRILLEGNRAVGVEVQISKGKQGVRAEFRAPVIVSDAGAWNTFARMLPASALLFRDQLKTPPQGFEVVELFLGLRRDPRELGFKGENHWIFESFDHDEMYGQRNQLLDGRTAMAYLSFPSLKDTRAQPHTAEIIAPLPYGSLEVHRHELWRRRSVDYESAKNRITRALLDLVERHYPGFGDLVEYSELATPPNIRTLYGGSIGNDLRLSGHAGKVREGVAWPAHAHTESVFTGSDVALLGIMGALIGAVVTASCVLGRFGFLEVMRAARSG
jgi:all-trans-retinol 13,14-reductase